MHESLFIQFLRSIFPKLNVYITERETPKKRTYLHKTMLEESYSPDQKWEGSTANTTYVAADIVEMDSPLPLKKRGSIATSNGRIPKLGMKKILFESGINNINIMRAQLNAIDDTTETGKRAKAAEKKRILTKLLDDGVFCSVGIDEKTEMIFLEALSNGVVAVEDEDNNGKAVRFNYGYLPSNQFKTEKKGVPSKEDIDRVFAKADADGNSIEKVMLSKTLFNKIKKERWAKELVADESNLMYTSESVLRTPSTKSLLTALQNEFDAVFEIVDRTIAIEKNGAPKYVKPWNPNNMIFLCNDMVGSLVWGTLAESTDPVKGVEYATVEKYKLISKYSSNEPSLQEVTAGQALVVPVIENVNQIYLLSTDSQEVDEEKEKTDSDDTKTTYAGKTYKKTELIAAIKAANIQGISIKSNSTDETIIKALNSLSDEELSIVLSKCNPTT